MKIISIRWKAGSSDFIHVICNDDVSRAQFTQLKRADIEGLFDIAEFAADSFTDALNYVKTETASYQKDVAADNKGRS